MKRVFFLALIFVSFLTFAQVPQGISYQAIAVNSSGNPVSNTNVGVQLSILDSSITGAVIYKETHLVMTGSRGLFNLVIGLGTPLTGTFSTIDWANNAKFLKVELDTAGGTNYELVGITQLWSVPYALYAESAKSVDASGIVGQADSNARASGFMTSDTGYYFLNAYNAPSQWLSHPLAGQPLKIVGSEYNIGILTSTHAYVAAINSYMNSAQWYSVELSGLPIKIISSGGKFGVLTTTNAYVFSNSEDANVNQTFTWYNQTLEGEPIDIVPLFRGFGVITTSKGYGFGKTILNSTPESSCSWYPSESITGNFIKTIVNEDVLSIFTTSNCYTFTPVMIPNGVASFQWKSTSLSGTFIDAAK